MHEREAKDVKDAHFARHNTTGPRSHSALPFAATAEIHV
jgi:hypothetical protein